MSRFEAGKRYYESGATFEVTRRTAKFVTMTEIQHAGRFNERIVRQVRCKIQEWPGREVVIIGYRTLEAA